MRALTFALAGLLLVAAEVSPRAQAPSATPDFAGVYPGTATQVIAQAKGVLVTLLWSGIGSFIIYKVVDLIVGLRPTSDAEVMGLDLTSHGEVAYHSS